MAVALTPLFFATVAKFITFIMFINFITFAATDWIAFLGGHTHSCGQRVLVRRYALPTSGVSSMFGVCGGSWMRRQ